MWERRPSSRLAHERCITRRDGPCPFVRPTYCAFLQSFVLVADEIQNCIHVVPAGTSAPEATSSGPPAMLPVDKIEGAVGATEEETSNLRFSYPTGVATDGTNLFVADSLNYRIQKLRLSDLRSLGCAGSRGSGDNQLKGPQGLALDGDLLFVSDFWTHRVLVYDTELNYVRSFGSEGNGPAEMCKPTGIAVHRRGTSGAADTSEVLVADSGNGRVQIYTAEGEWLRSIGSSGHGERPSGRRPSRDLEGSFNNPRGLAVAGEGDGAMLLLAEYGGKRVHLLGLDDGAQLQACAPPMGGGLCGVCVANDHEASRKVFVVDGTSSQLHVFSLPDLQHELPAPPWRGADVDPVAFDASVQRTSPSAQWTTPSADEWGADDERGRGPACEDAEPDAAAAKPVMSAEQQGVQAELRRTRELLARARGEESAVAQLGLDQLLALELEIGAALASVQSRRASLTMAEQRRNECVCCYDRKRTIAFAPCGHKVCCEICAHNVDKCPTCRVEIQQRLVIYES